MWTAPNIAMQLPKRFNFKALYMLRIVKWPLEWCNIAQHLHYIAGQRSKASIEVHNVESMYQSGSHPLVQSH